MLRKAQAKLLELNCNNKAHCRIIYCKVSANSLFYQVIDDAIVEKLIAS